jgi:hypothetical protein
MDRSTDCSAVKVAVFELAPLPPFVEVTGLDVLLKVPAEVVVTSTLIVQVPPTAIVPLLEVSIVSLDAGEKVGAPQFKVLELGMAATCIPAGRLSVKLTPVKGTVFPAGAVRVKVRVLVPPSTILVGAKDLLIVGGATTVSEAEAVLPFPPFVEVTVPLVLFFTPLVTPTTLTVTVQVLFGTIVPPAKVTEVAVLDTAPPHCAGSGAMLTVRPAGKLSVKPTPVSGIALVIGFVMVNVNIEVSPTAMEENEKALLMVGATTAYTVTLLWFDVTMLPRLTASIAVAVARFITEPAVTSAAVTV